MPRYPVEYAKFYLPPSPAFPKGRVVSRPILALTLINGIHKLSCYAIVDSGADHCAFPLSFIRPLRLDPLRAGLDATSGLGSYNVPTYFWNITIDLHGKAQFGVYAGFTEGLNQWGVRLLGQSGFFDRFNVAFNHRNGIFELEI